MKTILLTALLLLLAHSAHTQSLLNLKLGPGYKTGPAAIGIATNDFWNHYHPTNNDGTLFNDGVLVPLYSSDGTNLAAGMLVWNVAQAGTNTVGDAMFDYWLAANGTNLSVILTNVPYGSYDIYVYGHGHSNELNSTINLMAAWADYGTYSTTNTSAWSTNLWTEGAQFVVFRDVMVPLGHNLEITVSTNTAGLAILNGLQLVGKEVPENQDTDGDGLTDRQELAWGSNPFSADTAGDGIGDYVRWLQGRSPTAPAVADTSGVINLQVFSVLK